MDKRFFAITVALLLTLAIMITPLPGIADAGSFSGDTDFGGSWDSGSDWGGSSHLDSYYLDSDYSDRHYSSGSSSQRGDMSDWLIILLLLLMSAGIVIYPIWRYDKERKPAGARRTVLPMTIAELRKIDPTFNERRMKKRIAKLYIKMQRCWQEKTWGEMRTSMDDAIFNQFNSQLNYLIKNGRTNYVDNIRVLSVKLAGFGQKKKYDIITAIVKARFKDYTVDDATGKVVSGSKTATKILTYEWTLVRTRGAKSNEQGADETKTCPNCGAPLDLNASAKCEYCGAVIQSAEFDWVIKSIKGLSQRTISR